MQKADAYDTAPQINYQLSDAPKSEDPGRFHHVNKFLEEVAQNSALQNNSSMN